MSGQTPKEGGLPAWAVNWGSGIMSGFACAVVGHPFDTVKVRLQAQCASNPLFQGPGDCVRQTWAKEGLAGFYKGVGSPLVGQLILRSWMFLSYGKAKELVGGTQDARKLSYRQLFASGTLTGLLIAHVEGPIDFFKSQLQVQVLKQAQGQQAGPAYKGVFHAGYLITKERGLRGWFQGYPATIARNCCCCGLYFSTYEMTRRWFAGEGGNPNHIGLGRNLIAGSMGGFAYWCLIFPLDSVKSAMQSDSIHPKERKYANYVDCVKKLHAEGGVKRFFRGYLPCILRSCPANAALFTSYQLTANFLNSI